MSALEVEAAPLAPPLAWFEREEPDHPVPLTYGKNGEVYGHLALWGSCHTGFLNGAFSECVKPPPSRNDYADFHLGGFVTAEGKEIAVGKITFNTGHAPLTSGLAAASRHYDNTGSVGAFVRARNGNHGIWLAGATRSNLTPEGVRDLRANPPSGDWRSSDGNLELVASLAVPVPGFPVARPQLALAASAAGEAQVVALILPGWSADTPDLEAEADVVEIDYREKRQELVASLTPPRDDKAYLRRRAVLADTIR